MPASPSTGIGRARSGGRPWRTAHDRRADRAAARPRRRDHREALVGVRGARRPVPLRAGDDEREPRRRRGRRRTATGRGQRRRSSCVSVTSTVLTVGERAGAWRRCAHQSRTSADRSALAGSRRRRPRRTPWCDRLDLGVVGHLAGGEQHRCRPGRSTGPANGEPVGRDLVLAVGDQRLASRRRPIGPNFDCTNGLSPSL